MLSVEVEAGQQASSGLEAMTVADLSALELPVYVAEVDISKVQLGQPASITIDALPDQVLSGEVSRIAPTSESDSGVVNYEVTIRLNDLNLEDGVRPGMTTGLDPALSPDGQWVAFTRWETSQDGALGSLWVINVDGSGERVIHENVHNPRTPVWSVDGTQIVISMQLDPLL